MHIFEYDDCLLTSGTEVTKKRLPTSLSLSCKVKVSGGLLFLKIKYFRNVLSFRGKVFALLGRGKLTKKENVFCFCCFDKKEFVRQEREKLRSVVFQFLAGFDLSATFFCFSKRQHFLCFSDKKKTERGRTR